MQKPENLVGLSPSSDSERSASGSPASSSKSSQNRVILNDMKDGRRKSVSRRGDESAVIDSFPETSQAGDLFSATVRGRRLPPVRGILTTTSLCFLHMYISAEGNISIAYRTLHHKVMGQVLFLINAVQYSLANEKKKKTIQYSLHFFCVH